MPTYLRLELEPRFLVGNVLYELPEKADRDAMLKLLERVRTLMQAVGAALPVPGACHGQPGGRRGPR